MLEIMEWQLYNILSLKKTKDKVDSQSALKIVFISVLTFFKYFFSITT